MGEKFGYEPRAPAGNLVVCGMGLRGFLMVLP